MTDYASERQLSRIHRLLDERVLTGRLASRLIEMLEDCPDPAMDSGHNRDINEQVLQRIEREP